MQVIKKLIKSQYIIGTLFYSFPGLFSIIISIISIPIFLNYADPILYANYLISHFVLTISIITNLNIGKISTMNIVKNQNNKYNIFVTSLIFTFFISSTFTAIIYFIFINLINFFNLENIFVVKNFNIFIKLNFSNFYFPFEGFLKGNLNYKILSFCNLIFYSVSISIPSLLVLYNYNINLFLFSILIKLLVITIMLVFILKNIKIVRFVLSKSFVNDCIKNLKWMTLNTSLHQIYNYFDKYIIKVFLDNLTFIYYTVSQQISSKFGDPLIAYNNIFIAKTKKLKKNSQDNLSYSTLFYCIFCYFIFLILYFFLEYFLKLWLRDAYSVEYYNLIKIFFLTISIGSFSKLIVDYYDIVGLSKKSSYIEITFLFPFVFAILYSITLKNVYIVVWLIFLKEMLTLAIRFYFINKLFIFKKVIFAQLFFLILNSVLWYLELNIIIPIIIQSFHLILFFPIKKFQKFL